MSDVPSELVRRRFLDERRVICESRMDTLHAPVYDERWGSYINDTHRGFVQALVDQVQPGATVLDAACGTGKYWAMLLSAGLGVVGIDHSAGMLQVARAKHPDVTVSRGALQDLHRRTDLGRAMDGLLCVDALENVGPEDWPVVVQGLAHVLKPGAPAYVTLELPDGDAVMDDDARTAPLVGGEVLEGGSYHFYPSPDRAREWLTQEHFGVRAEAEGDGYHHFLLRRL